MATQSSTGRGREQQMSSQNEGLLSDLTKVLESPDVDVMGEVSLEGDGRTRFFVVAETGPELPVARAVFGQILPGPDSPQSDTELMRQALEETIALLADLGIAGGSRGKGVDIKDLQACLVDALFLYLRLTSDASYQIDASSVPETKEVPNGHVE